MPLSNPDNKVIFRKLFVSRISSIDHLANTYQGLGGDWKWLRFKDNICFYCSTFNFRRCEWSTFISLEKVANTSRVWRGNKVAINQVGDRSAHFSLRVETCSNCKYNLCQGRSQGHQPPLMDSCGCTIFNTAYWSLLKTRWYYFQK